MWLDLLPCRLDALVFREAHRGLLGIIRGLGEMHGYMRGKVTEEENPLRHHFAWEPRYWKDLVPVSDSTDRRLAGILQTDKDPGGEHFLLLINAVSHLYTSLP